MTIAERFRQARKAKGLSQDDVAELAKISQPSYFNIEAGKTLIPRHMERYADIFDVPIEWLQYGKGKNPFDPNAKTIPEANCPILRWGRVMDWLSGNREAAVSEMQGTTYAYNASHNSYALRIETPSMLSDESAKPSFRIGTIIIVEPEKKPKTGSFVIVSMDGKEPILRQFIKEGSDQIVTRMDPGLDHYYLSENDKILGVVVAHIDLMD